MERFYKHNLIKIPDDFYKNDIEMQIIEWWAQDEEDDDTEDIEDDVQNELNTDVYTIRCFGVTQSGISVTCKITGFKPFYYIKVPNTFSKIHLGYFLKHIESSYFLKSFSQPLVKENGKHRSCIEQKKDLFGFRNGKEYKYVKLVFNNYSALMKSRYLFKKAIEIANVTKRPTKFKLYESNFEPFMRYCHIKDILMAGWIRLPKGKYNITSDSATTQVELSIDRKLIVSMKEHQDLANFLQASWDIEVYSHDRTFPDPKYKITKNGNVEYPNEIFQIATTYKYVKGNTSNKDGFLVKHLLTLKRCESIDDPNVIVEECKTEKELIKRWVDTVSMMDPDIFYTYNGDSFDCMYLVERAELLGLVTSKRTGTKTYKDGYLLKKLSRMTSKAADIKKEYFQYFRIPETLDKYYDIENKRFMIETKSFGTIQMRPPSIGVMQKMTTYIKEKQKNGSKIDQSVLQIMPYLISEWRGFSDNDIFKFEIEMNGWSNKKYSLIYKLAEQMKVGIQPNMSVQIGDDEEVVPISFRDGIKSLFIVQDFAGELL